MPITEMNAWKRCRSLSAQIKSLQDEIVANKKIELKNYRQKRSARSVERK